MNTQPFNVLPEAYEAMINWPKRLSNEEPLFRWLFEQTGGHDVLDAACGTGHHAALFHSWGLKVEAADISEPMIRWCRNHHPETENLRWVVRGYDQPIGSGGLFNAVTCTGNSLALAPDMATIEAAMAQMLRALRPGGALLVHVLNLWRLPDGPCQWQKCLRAPLSQGESLILKGIHRCGGRGFVDVAVTQLNQPVPRIQTESAPFWGLEADHLEAMARQSGAIKTECFGSFKRELFDREKSQDLIMVAWK